MSLAMERYEIWRNQRQMDATLAAELSAMEGDADRITDSFACDLAFGTAGLRGILGAGTNRMNIYTVARATQGLAEWLSGSGLPQKAAIAYDSRNGSVLFSRTAARVLAANGITVYLYPRLEPTPALSFAVRYYGCGTGINVTASHNPAQYNGYKVYGPDGCQIGPETADAVLAKIEQLDYFTGPKYADFEAAKASGKIIEIPDSCLEAFVDAVYAQRVGSGEGMEDLKLVYTPLNGAGLECIRMLAEKLGVKNMTVVPEQEKPDCNFPTCPYPNPEIRQAKQKGLELCETVKPDLLLGTDPDCDRCGTAVPDHKGGYRLISGNEMGVILLDYICRSRIANGRMPEKPVAVTTIVSTDMVDAVAERYGVELRRVLTGFKFIGEQIGNLEAAGEESRYIFGFEESYGYLSGTHVRDKDAVNASLLIMEAAAYYAQKGMNLGDVIDSLYEQYGYYRNDLCSFTFEGVSGMQTMQDIMERLRADKPAALAGRRVLSSVDYENDDTGLPRAQVLEYRLDGKAKLIVRPSGTEPKIKVYLSAVGKTHEEADIAIETMKKTANELMQA